MKFKCYKCKEDFEVPVVIPKQNHPPNRGDEETVERSYPCFFCGTENVFDVPKSAIRVDSNNHPSPEEWTDIIYREAIPGRKVT